MNYKIEKQGGEILKKLLKVVLVIVLLVIAIGYGIYYFGTNVASDKVMDILNNELEKSGQLETVKESIKNDPDLKKFVEEGANIDESKLPFKTKEEATRVIIRKVGISELQNIKSQLENGTASKEEIYQTIENKLSDEEIQALKVIAYKELSK